MTKILALITKARAEVAAARKALIVAVPAIGLIVGTDNPTYIKVIAALVAAGVYKVGNTPKA